MVTDKSSPKYFQLQSGSVHIDAAGVKIIDLHINISLEVSSCNREGDICCLPCGRTSFPIKDCKAQFQGPSHGGRLRGCCKVVSTPQQQAHGSPHTGALSACTMRQVSQTVKIILVPVHARPVLC